MHCSLNVGETLMFSHEKCASVSYFSVYHLRERFSRIFREFELCCRRTDDMNGQKVHQSSFHCFIVLCLLDTNHKRAVLWMGALANVNFPRILFIKVKFT